MSENESFTNKRPRYHAAHLAIGQVYRTNIIILEINLPGAKSWMIILKVELNEKYKCSDKLVPEISEAYSVADANYIRS